MGTADGGWIPDRSARRAICRRREGRTRERPNQRVVRIAQKISAMNRLSRRTSTLRWCEGDAMGDDYRDCRPTDARPCTRRGRGRTKLLLRPITTSHPLHHNPNNSPGRSASVTSARHERQTNVQSGGPLTVEPPAPCAAAVTRRRTPAHGYPYYAHGHDPDGGIRVQPLSTEPRSQNGLRTASFATLNVTSYFTR